MINQTKMVIIINNNNNNEDKNIMYNDLNIIQNLKDKNEIIKYS